MLSSSFSRYNKTYPIPATSEIIFPIAAAVKREKEKQ